MKTIIKICENPNCQREFEVRDTKVGRSRKYCKQTCQIPWLKGKKGVYSKETIEKKREASKLWCKTKKGKKHIQKTILRNMSSKNPWRKSNYKKEWQEKATKSRKKTLQLHPEIRQLYASMKGKNHLTATLHKMSLARKKWWKNASQEQKLALSDKSAQKRKELNRLGLCKYKIGSNHPNWKGGFSSIVQLVYANRRLYQDWKNPILHRDSYKCVECGCVKNLTIHHDRESLSSIFHKLCKSIDDVANKNEIVENIVDYHIKNKVSGVTLCKLCHKKLHHHYNFKGE